MPEEPEIETEKLHEMIQEKTEHAEPERGEGAAHHRWISGVAVTTAVIAALAAIAALRAGDTVNRALMYKSEASIDQTRASDQWTYFQAKGTRQQVAEVAGQIIAGQGGSEAAAQKYRDQATRYANEKAAIQKKAQDFEAAAHALNVKAEVKHVAHERFAPAVTLFQIAIALSAIAVLTNRRVIWIVGLLVALSGLGFFIVGFMPVHLLEDHSEAREAARVPRRAVALGSSPSLHAGTAPLRIGVLPAE